MDFLLSVQLHFTIDLFNLFYDYLIESGVKEEQIISIALDDDTFIKYRDPEELSKFIRAKIVSKDMYYVLIDEVQYAIAKEELKNPDSIRLYNVLNGLMRLRNVDIYVTGSNSKMLTKDVLTVFRGRGDEVRVYPMEPLNNRLYLVSTQCISRHLRLAEVISAQNSHYLSTFLLRFPKKGRLPLCQVVESFRPAIASAYKLAQANIAYSRFSFFLSPRYTVFL